MGKKLANRLRYEFIDTDEEMVRVTNEKIDRNVKTIQELYTIIGEKEFRDLEEQVINQVSELDEMIISLGGGSLQINQNGLALKKNGIFVWLQIPIQILSERIANQLPRPLFRNKDVLQELTRLQKIRSPQYKTWADIIIDGTSAPSIIVETILEKIQLNSIVFGQEKKL